MANDLNRSIKIYLDNSSAMESANQLKGRIGELEQKLKSLQTTGQGNSAQAQKLTKELAAQTKKYEQYKQKVAETDRVLKNLSGATYNELLQAKKAVETQLKKTERGTELYNNRLRVHKALTKEITLAQQEMRAQVGAQGSMWSRAADGINKYAGIAAGIIGTITGVTFALNKMRDERDKLEDTSADVKALTGLNDDDMQYLIDQAKTLSTTMTKEGVRIRSGANDILEAYKVVGGAKSDLLQNKEALAEVTKQTLILATASKMDMKEAAEAAILSMNQYGAAAEEASRYVNVLAAGSAAGAAEVDNIVNSVVKAGVSAASANIPIEQLVGSIEVLAERGIKDEIAGTGLKRFFLTLQTGADETNPKVVGLINALEELKKKNLSASEVKDMFGEQGYNVATVMIDSIDKVKELTAAVTDTRVAVEQAQIVSDTSAAKRAQATNQLKLMGVELIENLNPSIIRVMNSTVSWTRTLIDVVKWIQQNVGMVLTLIGTLALYTAAIKLNTYWKTVSHGATLKAVAAEKASSIAVRASIAAEYASIAAKRLLAGNIRLATAAMRSFLLTLGLNPITAFAVALGALAVGIYKVWDNATKTTRAIRAMNKEIANEQAEAHALFDALNKSNVGSQRRKDLIEEINSKYGSYLGNLLSEKSTTEEIATALNTVNEKIKENIALKTMQKAKEEVLSDSLETQRKAMDGMRERSGKIGAFLTESMLGDVKRITEEGQKAGKKWQETYSDITAFIDHHYSAREKVDKGFWTNLGRYVEDVYDVSTKLDKVTKSYSQFIPKSSPDDTSSWSHQLPEVIVTAATITPEKAAADEKEILDARLKEVNRYIQDERIKLQEKYLSGKMDKMLFEDEMRQLELDALSRKLSIYNLDKDKQAEIQESIQKHKIKLLEELQRFEEQQLSIRSRNSLKQKKEEEKREQDRLKSLNEELKERAKLNQENSAEEFETELERRKKFIEITESLATDLGGIVGGALSGNSDLVKSSLISIINMGLDMLKIQTQMAVAGATIQSLASAESVATFGAAGFAKAAIMTGLIEAAFTAVKAVVGSLVSNFGSSTTSSTTSTSSDTGKRVVTGYSEGGYTGHGGVLEVAGDVHRMEYVVPAWEMQEPAAMNHVMALEAIRRERTSANPLPTSGTGFAEGGYTGNSSQNISLDKEMYEAIKKLNSLLSESQPLKAYIVLSELQAKIDTQEKSKKIGSK